MPLSKILPSGVSQPTPVNLIINGNMNIYQRGSDTIDHDGTTAAYVLDRFKLQANAMDELHLTVTQDSSVPSGYGFANSMKVDITTAESALASDEYVRILHPIEAQNLQLLNYGTSGAKTIALSFWVKSNLTGAFAVSIYQADGDRIIGSTYTISSANTWEKKTITFVGDTGGTINDDNGAGFYVNFCLATGSDRTGTDNSSWSAFANAKMFNGQVANITSSASNDFYLTGVMLTAGSHHHDFIHESYAETLYKCERYYQQLGGYTDAYTRLSAPTVVGNTQANWTFPFKTIMRATPSLTATAANWILTNGSASKTLTSLGLTRSDVTQAFLVMQWSGTEFGVGQSVEGYANNDTSYRMQFDSEL